MIFAKHEERKSRAEASLCAAFALSVLPQRKSLLHTLAFNRNAAIGGADFDRRSAGTQINGQVSTDFALDSHWDLGLHSAIDCSGFQTGRIIFRHAHIDAAVGRCHVQACAIPAIAIQINVDTAIFSRAFDIARQHGIPTARLSPTMFPEAEPYESALVQLLTDHAIQIIVLAGYMRRLPLAVVRGWEGKILNVHPALLPDFGGQGMYGMNVHQAVIAARRTESGATVHLVDQEYDTGAIIAQERVPVLPDDTPETLAARVLQAEHHLLPQVVMEMVERELENGNRRGTE